jgi:F-type H+-transporting ATPase subunit gamma
MLSVGRIARPGVARLASPLMAGGQVAFVAPEGARTAMSIQQLKMKITSTTNLRKITKAMKMVASSKLKQVEKQLFAARPGAASMDRWFDGNIAPEDEFDSEAICVITSDKGLCGGVNNAVLKPTRAMSKEKIAAGKTLTLEVIGEKGKSLERDLSAHIHIHAGDIGRRPMTFLQASLIAEEMSLGSWDKMTLLFNRYVNMISYDLAESPLFSASTLQGALKTSIESKYELEGDEGTILANLAEFRLAYAIYAGYLESATSEQSARMTAMDNSTKNAGELIDKLTIQYNRTRQAKITTELIEIISGAESLKSGAD